MIVKFGVAVIPVSVFYDSPQRSQGVRFCFAKNDSTLRDALQRISAAL